MDTPAHRELKEGNINLLDCVTRLNGDSILSKQWFEQSTRDKTRPELTLWRSIKDPYIRLFLAKGIIITIEQFSFIPLIP